MKTLRRTCFSLTGLILLVSSVNGFAAEAKFAKHFVTSSLPPDVGAAIQAANNNGDIFSVTGSRAYGGQVLKAGVITFQPNSKLILNNYSVPWVAIVTNQLQFVDTSTSATIEFNIDWQPGIYAVPSTPATPRQAAKGPTGRVGSPGANGSPGTAGHNGDTAPVTPKLYLVVGGVADQLSQPVPAALNLTVLGLGYSGGAAADGGAGGAGGSGGDGGNGQMGTFFQGCLHSAGVGGPGGVGGEGGPGGIGGNGSPGSNVLLDGPLTALLALSYAAYQLDSGPGGAGGHAGASGRSGTGGARGSYPGTCTGGGIGATPVTPPTAHVKSPDGTGGATGVVTQTTDNNVGRFFQN